jgi:hypothetical protein
VDDDADGLVIAAESEEAATVLDAVVDVTGGEGCFEQASASVRRTERTSDTAASVRVALPTLPALGDG